MTAEEYIQKVREVPGFDGKFRTIQRLAAENGLEVSDYIRPRPKKADRTKLIVTCPRHGTKEISMRRFTERGIFWCSECEASKGGSRTGTGRDNHNQPYMLYLAVSECSKYLKVGITKNSPEVRVRQVNGEVRLSGGNVVFNKYSYLSYSNESDARRAEVKIKRGLEKYVQTDLPKFCGSTEVFKGELRSLLKFIVDILRLPAGLRFVGFIQLPPTKSEINAPVAQRNREHRESAKEDADLRRQERRTSKENVAREICLEGGTELVSIDWTTPISNSIVTKRCLKDSSHSPTSCKLDGLIYSKRGGCKACATEKANSARWRDN